MALRDRGVRERGQTLVLITVFMMSLLGAAALAVDVGQFYLTKRAVQAAADASALAGASQLSVEADLRLFRLMGETDRNVGRFGVGVRYRF